MTGRLSEMPGLRRRRMPVIVKSVEIGDWRIDEFLDGDIVQAGNIDGVKRSPTRGSTRPEGLHSAVPAKQVSVRFRVELIPRQLSLA